MKQGKTCWLMGALFALSCGVALAQYTDPVEVETSAFGQDTFGMGSLSAADGALPADLWFGAQAEDLAFLLDHVPARFSDPAQADLLRRVLLTPGDGPQGANSKLTGKKLMALAQAGFYEQASSFAELSGRLSNEPELAQSAAYAEMMRGDLNAACRRGANLQSGRNSAFWLKLRFMCYSLSGETSAADLTFGLLKEQEILSDLDEVLFTALATGSKPKGNLSPKTGFQYVTIRQLQLPLDLDRFDEVDGAVLVALSGETSAPQQARVYAAERAVHFGFMSGQDLAGIFSSFEFPIDRIASVKQLLIEQPENHLVDALAYQAIQQMMTIEFSFDRAALAGEALRVADSLQRFSALARLYAPTISQFEVVSNYAPYATEFALAGILAGDDGLAARWVTALAMDTTKPESLEAAVALLQLWSLRDENRAQVVGGYAGLTITRPEISMETLNNPVLDGGSNLIPDLVRISLSSGGQSSKGQAALVTLLTSAISASGDLESVRQIVQANSLRVSALGELYNERAFAKRAESLIKGLRSTSSSAGTTNGQRSSPTAGSAANIKPRVKPSPNE